MSFRDSLVAGKPPVVTQIHETDPFGLQIDALSYENNGSNTFKFQNQEKINDFGLNWNFFAYRFSDGETGRFFQIDPLASKYVHNSPYAFSENKVTNHLELEGLEAVPIVYPSLQNELYRAGGLTHQPNQKENESFAVSAGIAVAKAFAMVALIALPIEEAIVVGAGAALKGLGLVAKEVGVAAKVEGAVVKAEASVVKEAVSIENSVNTGRGSNHLKPDGKATTDHSTFRTDPQTGKTTNTATYRENPQNPKTGFDEVKRVDVTGASHRHSKTGVEIKTPHVHEPQVKDPRAARTDELPRQ